MQPTKGVLSCTEKFKVEAIVNKTNCYKISSRKINETCPGQGLQDQFLSIFQMFSFDIYLAEMMCGVQDAT